MEEQVQCYENLLPPGARSFQLMFTRDSDSFRAHRRFCLGTGEPGLAGCGKFESRLPSAYVWEDVNLVQYVEI